MSFDVRRIEKVISTVICSTFHYNTIIDLDDNVCVTFTSKEDIKERSFNDFLEIARQMTHPLFRNKLESDLDINNLKQAFADRRTVRVEALIKGPDGDEEYHWNKLRLIPIDDDSGHIVFFLNFLLIDDDIKKSEQNRSEVFNKAIIEQLIYNYILVYVIDLSNGMSRLVYSNGGDDYDVYARQFKSHLEMMNDVCTNYVSEDFQVSFTRFMDYDYIKKQLDEKERLVLIFRDRNGTAFEMTVSKYPEYADDYPIVIFALKELS